MEDEMQFFSGDQGKPNYLVVEDEVRDTMEICGWDECFGCRYGSCNTCPPLVAPDSLYMEFKDWDELSDEAWIEFEKLAEESGPTAFSEDMILEDDCEIG